MLISGKSTIINKVTGEESEPVPTVGFVPHTVKVGGKQIKLYDVGGGSRIRGIWRSYYAEVYGLIYVVDSTDISRIIETQETLNTMLENEYLQDKPIIVFANKQDANGALTSVQLSNKLNITNSRVNVMDCSAINPVPDKNIKNGIAWIMKYISSNYDVLLLKVSKDLADIKEVQDAKRLARKERVRLAKEERAKEEEEEKEEVPADSDDDDMVCSPFQPIKQAFTEPVPAKPVPHDDTAMSPELKKPKKLKKKKKKGNKVMPFSPKGSENGSQKSLISSGTGSVEEVLSETALPPLKSPIVCPPPDKYPLKSLPPIKLINQADSDPDSDNFFDAHESLKSDSPCLKEVGVAIPNIFQNKYIDVDSLSEVPLVKLDTLHTIKIDRSVFVKNLPAC